MLIGVITGNVVILGLLSYLLAEMRSDIRQTRDKVLIIWDWYENTLERRKQDAEA